MFQFHPKYKNKSFEEISELIKNDKKIMQTFIRTLNHPNTSSDKKNEIQRFIDFYNTNMITMITLKTNLKSIKKIFHISDIHIRLYNRQKEYQDVFQKLYQYIKENSINKEIIIITGDLLHSKNNLSPESILITQNFLINLANLCPTFLIAGNHDAMLSNNQREDSITAIVKNVQIPNFHYLKNTAVYLFANIAISVCSILDNKWIYANSFQTPENIQHKIALYHGGVGIVETGVGHRLRGEKLISDFEGYDFTLLGDIHKYQWLIPNKMAYSSSLIAQNFSEFHDPHGVLVWNLETLEHIYHPIENQCGFFILHMNNNQLFINEQQISKDDISNYLQNITSSLQVKLNIQNCSYEFVLQISNILQNISNDVKIILNYLGISPINNPNFSQIQEVNAIYDNLSLKNLLINHIQKTKPNLPQNDVQFILQKYQDFAANASIQTERNLAKWELIDLKFSNLFGYGPNNFIDFQRFSEQSTIGIIAPNSHGKSSLIDIILFALFSKFSRTRGTSISKDLININATNFDVKLRFKIGADIYTIYKEGKREQTDKIKITQNQLLKQTALSPDTINLTDENRLKTDKIIAELIGSYDDMTFTNVQLQNHNNSFKDMSDKDRKDYLYKILKLDIWNSIVDEIKNYIKPIKSQITYLEKSMENTNIDKLKENICEMMLKINELNDAIEQQLYEKEINMENIGIISNMEISQLNSKITLLTNDKLRITEEMEKLNLKIVQGKIDELEKEKSEIKLIGFFTPNTKMRDVKTIENELNAKTLLLEADEIKIASIPGKFAADANSFLSTADIIKNDKIIDILREKVKKFENDLLQYNENNIKKFLKDESIHNKIRIQKNIRESIILIMSNFSSHKYDPNCKFCIQNPIVQEKQKKEDELKQINLKIEALQLQITFPIEDNEVEIYSKQNEELVAIKEMFQIKKTKLEKLETDKERSLNYIKYKELSQSIKSLQNSIKSLQIELINSKQFYEINTKNIELQLLLDSINLKIKNEMKLLNEFNNLKNQLNTNNIELTNYQNILIESKKSIIIRDKIKKNDKIIADSTIKMGKLQQQITQSKDELRKFIEINCELEEKKIEYGLIKILEDSLNKDGLPLQILNHYLTPITEQINGIISPFISRKICLRIENDDLILDSFPNQTANKSVFMHGGMESFILDIAFKITLSNFAKLPKCNILFLDEGISAFDSERLANIDILFSFIQNYFPKTVLITHLDSVKENIQEKIMITKVNELSQIECFYIR